MLAGLYSAMPTTGGLYYFAAKLSQRHDMTWMMPIVTWLTGWFNVLGNVALVASIDWSLA